MQSSPKDRQVSKLGSVLALLELDPVNVNLLANAALQAFDAGDLDLTSELIGRHADLKALPAGLENLRGLIAITQRKYSDAVDILSGLRLSGADSPALRFNLAWAHAMDGSWLKALELLDEDSVAVSPHAPALKIQMLHHLARLDDALACGQDLSKRFPDNQALMGAMASLAIDAEKPDLAEEYAKRPSAEPPAADKLITK